MNPRISTSMVYHNSVSHMLSKQARIDHIGRQLASEERLVTAKDDPVDAGSALDIDRSLAALKQYGKNANFLQSRLGLQENALESAGQIMNRAKELVIEAGNAILAPENRKAIAVELENIKDSLLDLANTADGNGRFLFAGSADAKAPFTSSAGKVSYHGDDIQRETEIAPETLVKDTLPGSAVFFDIGPDREDAFAVLDHLIRALNNADISSNDLQNAVDAGLRDITLSGEKFINARTHIGAQQAQIDAAAELRAANEVSLKTSLSSLRDLDYAQAIGDFNLEKIALQAAQSVFMQMQGMSLFERMR